MSQNRAAVHAEGARPQDSPCHMPNSRLAHSCAPGPAPLHVYGRGKLQPLEFTTDPAAIRAHARLADDEQLQAKVAEVIAESGLGSMPGVGIYARERSIAKATSVFLEETRFAQRQSVVHVLPRLPPAPRRPIPTLWVSGLDGDLFCETICLAYCSHEPSLGIGYCGHVKGQHVGKT